MKLTRRQETFIRNLLDLSRELEGPIHYSVLAERVGVSRITAYDMLRILEEKGFVRSDYQRSGEKSAPGRAEIVFWPTELARQRIARLFQELDTEDWETVKDGLLRHIQHGVALEDPDPEFTKAMMSRVPPDGPAPERYCIEVITVLSLRLRQDEGRRLLMDYLPTILAGGEPSSSIDLNLFSGFALGLLVAENSEASEWNNELLEHVKQCHQLIVGMNADQRHRLAMSMCEVLQPLNHTKNKHHCDMLNIGTQN